VQGKLRESISFKDFGAVGDGVADDTAALVAAEAEHATTGVKLTANKNDVFLISSQITVRTPCNIDFGGAKIVTALGMTSGFAVVLTGKPYTASNRGNLGPMNLTVCGPFGYYRGYGSPPSTARLSGNTLDGVNIVGTPVQVSDVELGISVDGFRDNIVFSGPNVYLLKFKTPQNGRFWRRGWSYIATTNSGENISIFGGSTFNGVADDGSATAFYSANTGNGEFFAFGHSLDYCDSFGMLNAGSFTFTGCHLENNNALPIFVTSKTGGSADTRLTLIDSAPTVGPGGSGYLAACPTAGRAVNITAGSGTFVEVRGGELTQYGRYLTEMVSASGSSGQVKLSGVSITGYSANLSVGDICRATTQTHNPSFLADIAGWTLAGSSGSVQSWDATEGKTTLGCYKNTDIGNSTGFNQVIGIPAGSAGRQVVVSCWVKTLNVLAAGKIAGLRNAFYNRAGVQIIEYFPATGYQIGSTSANGVWIKIGRSYQIPAGAESMNINAYQNGVNGTVWFDDIFAWLV
jgi:hypothetical protein